MDSWCLAASWKNSAPWPNSAQRISFQSIHGWNISNMFERLVFPNLFNSFFKHFFFALHLGSQFNHEMIGNTSQRNSFKRYRGTLEVGDITAGVQCLGAALLGFSLGFAQNYRFVAVLCLSSCFKGCVSYALVGGFGQRNEVKKEIELWPLEGSIIFFCDMFVCWMYVGCKWLLLNI